MNFNNIDEVIEEILNLIAIPKPPDPPIPAPIVMASSSRPGMSAQKMAAEVIKRKSETGLTVGPLPDGTQNPSELLEIIRMQVIMEEMISQGRITVVINPGIPIIASGIAANGVPVTVNGTTTGFGTGSGIFQ